MITQEQLSGARGVELQDASGAAVGRLGEVYLDDATGAPEWVTVATGLFGSRTCFVPVEALELVDGALRVPWEADLVRRAPRVAVDGHLEAEEEAQLYQHYGLEPPAAVEQGSAGVLATAPRTEAVGGT